MSFLQRQFGAMADPPTPGHDPLSGDGVLAGPLELLPIQPRAPFLPQRQVVEVDAAPVDHEVAVVVDPDVVESVKSLVPRGEFHAARHPKATLQWHLLGGGTLLIPTLAVLDSGLEKVALRADQRPREDRSQAVEFNGFTMGSSKPASVHLRRSDSLPQRVRSARRATLVAGQA